MTHKGMTIAIYKDEKTWFFSALVLLAISFLLYIYFLTSSVVEVVIREQIEHKIVEAGSSVSTLEAEYIEAQHSVSRDIATHEGFNEVANKTFITRTEGTLVLRVPNES